MGIKIKFETRTIEELNPYGFDIINFVDYKGNKILIEEDYYELMKRKYSDILNKYILIAKESYTDRMIARIRYLMIYLVLMVINIVWFIDMINLIANVVVYFLILYFISNFFIKRKKFHEIHQIEQLQIMNLANLKTHLTLIKDLIKLLKNKNFLEEDNCIKHLRMRIKQINEINFD